MSETELSIYDRISNPLDAIKMLGGAIAKSRIFGCETPDQGIILAWECLVRRVAPLSLKETYHLISTGKGVALTMRADAMLAGFLMLGGTHRIIRRDGDMASIELTKASGESQTFSCTFDEAQAAGFTDGKDGVKDNWSSPRQRMQMLWARVVSDDWRRRCQRRDPGRGRQGDGPDRHGRQPGQQQDPDVVAY
jgi:hypothetical protein